jgi:hypothetical protein
MRRKSPPEHRESPTRRFRIIAQDPGFRLGPKNARRIVTAHAEVPAEELLPGPTGYRVKVIDYDVSSDTLYERAEIPSGGERHSRDRYEAATDEQLLNDPGFHAQNVYAIVMRTLARFERALGRRVDWGCDGHQLHVVPHAFAEPNAFYSRHDRALFFGYFMGRKGRIFTCLSHDVIAHEATHAILDGLRSRFFLPSNPDQAAFHEGFADIVAMLSIFSLRSVVEAMLDDATGKDPRRRNGRRSRRLNQPALIHVDYLTPKWLKESAIFGLANQMGTELSGLRGRALRQSVTLDPSEVSIHSAEFEEEHRRGELLVAAMLNAFLAIWVEQVEKL